MNVPPTLCGPILIDLLRVFVGLFMKIKLTVAIEANIAIILK